MDIDKGFSGFLERKVNQNEGDDNPVEIA